ncbi:ROK family transcriptional regulator [Streptomyces sp. SPB074]|uniref:ROK family transcriptional regulator n=1 Tax=Streptomyces sp. (strain SPB074) TaxID=465543 RepID=UPI00017FED18|nr:ROK family transcriptional regulator [Streptomyces sp. SPB074]EDY44091.1 ROK family transcriptional regulator [Streptomyces sp. SPB074]
MTTKRASATKTSIRRGTNLPRMGDFNESVVLDAIRRHKAGLSRVELAEATGLSAQTVSNITRRLLDQGVARESGKQSTGSGKPRTLLQVTPGARYAIGVHLDPAVITYVLLDLLGTVVARRSEPTPRGVHTEALLAGMAASVGALIEDSGVDQERVLGLGIAAPGPVDPVAGLVIDPPELPGWGSFPLRERLEADTGFPALLDKDVVAAAVAERWSGAATDSRNFLFFYLGTGSGMGLVVDDTVLRGSSGNVGEVGGLGAACSSRALVEEAIELGALGHEFTPTDPQDAQRSLQHLARIAADGEPRAAGIIDRWGVRIGRGVTAAATLLDSDTIVFGGPLWPLLAPRLLPLIEPMVAESPFVKPVHGTTVTTTAIGEDVAAVGAACLVLDRTLSAQPRSLLLA